MPSKPSAAPSILAALALATLVAFPAAATLPPRELPADVGLGADLPTPGHVDDGADPEDLAALSDLPCEGGLAGPHPCDSIDLGAFLPLVDVSPANQKASDVWGWTDPETRREYAILGVRDGTSFIDVTEPHHPHWVAFVPTATFFSSWRDVKVLGNHALIVSEARSHGMQVFDLTRLRGIDHDTETLSPDAWYRGFGNAHNVAVNEDSARAYAVGTNSCGAGLHVVDLSDPLEPAFAGCVSDDGYTHDAQCVTYSGPDADWTGREVCLLSNEDTLTIVDVTDLSSPSIISRTGYPQRGYTHQGWLDESQSFFFMGDELDEWFYRMPTRTVIWDVRDLDAPLMHDEMISTTAAIDHNMYVKGQLLYQANYRAGLRIIDLGCFVEPEPREVGHFDVYPANDGIGFNGAWSVFPYFPSGTVVVSGIEQGLFVLSPTGEAACPDVDAPTLVGVPDDALAECPDLAAAALVRAVDGCDEEPSVTLVEETTPGDCPGRYTLVRTWTAKDSCGNETVGSQTIEVDDTTPPEIAASMEPVACLWPPSHRPTWIPRERFTVSVADACSGEAGWALVDCLSDQPDDGLGDGSTTDDCIVAPDGSGVWVRSERQGLEPAGRTVVVLAAAIDACGNASLPTPVGTVHVPHDAEGGCD